MWNTVRDFLRRVYLHVRQFGANYSISSRLFLDAVQTAIDDLWANTDWHWNWTHYKEAFTSFLVNDNNILKIVTTHPIDKIDSIYYWDMDPIDGSSNLCDCPDEPLTFDNEHIYIPCISPCYFWLINNWNNLDINVVKSQSQLMNWQAQISWSEVYGMWGHYWNIISMKLPFCWKNPNDTWLFVTYYRWPQQIESFDDVLMIPKWYWSVLAKICAKYLLPISWASRQNIEQYFDVLIDKELWKLKAKDTINPTGFRNKAV